MRSTQKENHETILHAAIGGLRLLRQKFKTRKTSQISSAHKSRKCLSLVELLALQTIENRVKDRLGPSCETCNASQDASSTVAATLLTGANS